MVLAVRNYRVTVTAHRVTMAVSHTNHNQGHYKIQELQNHSTAHKVTIVGTNYKAIAYEVAIAGRNYKAISHKVTVAGRNCKAIAHKVTIAGRN
jgi:hypothetical protein